MNQPEFNITENEPHPIENIPDKLPVLALRDVVVFPYMIYPVLLGRESSLKAATVAIERDKLVFLTAQKNPAIEEPTIDDIYREGTVAKIIQIMKLPNGLMKILVSGVAQGFIKTIKRHLSV